MARGELTDEEDEKEADEARAHQLQALAAFGLRPEGEQVRDTCETFALWPECVETWRLWLAVQTQWRTSMSGPTGLDYCGVAVVLDMRRIRGRNRRQAFDTLQMMERAALEAWREKRQDADK